MSKSLSNLRLKMDTKLLVVSQLLGYFPTSIKPQGHPGLKIISPLVPSIVFCIFGIGNTIIFIAGGKGQVHHRDSENGISLFSSTMYSTVYLKGLAHIFTIVFVRVTLLFGREQLARFYADFTSLVECFSLFRQSSSLTKIVPKVRNRFETRLMMEVILLGFFCLGFITDLWAAYFGNPVAGVYLNVY